MIIAIDISMLVYAGSGVARYTLNFVEALLTYHPEHTYKLLYSSRRRPSETSLMLKRLKKLGGMIYDLPFPPWVLKLIWNRLHVIPATWLIGKYDVFHSSDFLRPPIRDNALAITTIHDLTWKMFPDFHETSTIESHEAKMRKTIGGRDIVLVDSKNTERDLVHFFPEILPSHIYTLPLGIDDAFNPRPKDEQDRVRKNYQIDMNPYLLYVGAIEPRKRLDLCLKVFAKFKRIPKHKDYLFIVAGRAGWKNETIFQLVQQLGLTSSVKFTGYVPDADLPALYSGASATMYLSEYEGFGLPPLESLACGTPVLASSNSSVIEFVPKRFLSESADPIRLAKQLDLLISLKSNISLIEIDDFSWKKYADGFTKIVERLRSS